MPLNFLLWGHASNNKTSKLYENFDNWLMILFPRSNWLGNGSQGWASATRWVCRWCIMEHSADLQVSGKKPPQTEAVDRSVGNIQCPIFLHNTKFSPKQLHTSLSNYYSMYLWLTTILKAWHLWRVKSECVIFINNTRNSIFG